jgi:hypothetical protein
MADRVAHQLGDDRDGIGEQGRVDRIGEFGGEPVPRQAGAAGMVGNYHTPRSLCHSHRHA